MKLLHTSDWHLGRFMKTPGDLEPDQRHFLSEIYRIIRENRVDAVLLSGDVYDRAVASADTIRLYDEAMTQIVIRGGTPLLMIAGNHDGPARLASCNRLLRECGLHICGTLEREPVSVEVGDTQVFLLPWFTAEKARALYPEAAHQITDLTKATDYVCDRIRERFAPGKRHILMAHAFIVSAETSTSDRSAEVGLSAAVSAHVFRGFDYVALGHIHEPQTLGERVRYSGTPMAYAFGREETQQKSVTLLDTDTLEWEEIPLVPLHGRRTLEGTLEEIQAIPLTPALENSYIRVKITDTFLDGETRLRLEKQFPLLVEAAGKPYEDESSKITLTREELEQMENDPVELFKRFCLDEEGREADDHMIALLREAVRAAEEGGTLQ